MIAFDALTDALASWGDDLEAALITGQDHWETAGPACRALLRAYVRGEDERERTERAMFGVVLLLAGAEDTASFGALCALGTQPDRLASVFGDDPAPMFYGPALLSTYAGDPAPLFHLIEQGDPDSQVRSDGLMVLAYLTRTGRVPEGQSYDYLAGLPDRLQPQALSDVWFGYACAVGGLGFAGLSGAVQAAFTRGWIAPDLLTPAEFWADLREAQLNPGDVTSPVWAGLAPLGDPIEALRRLAGPEMAPAHEVVAEPIRNPLRGVGRNDPCPCGSGRKYKKCCL